MKEKFSLKSGFTIVELLIVIIVIAILATLVITAYNGVQAKAKNAKTVSAVESWAKALKFYQTEKGDLPSGDTCLGSTDTYPSGECEPGQGVDPGISDLQSYFGGSNYPEPDITKITDPDDSSDYRSGISYYSDGTTAYIWYVQAGTNNCPKIGALSDQDVQMVWSGGVQCVGQINE